MSRPLTDPLSTMTSSQAKAVRKVAKRAVDALAAIPHGLNGRISLADAGALLNGVAALRALAATDGLCDSDQYRALYQAEELERGATLDVPTWANYWRGLLVLLD